MKKLITRILSFISAAALTCTFGGCGLFGTTHTHSYTSMVVPPSCTGKGYTLYSCECGNSYKADEVNATGHNYDEGKFTEPTCFADGGVIYTCNSCGEKYIEPSTKLDKLEHNLSFARTVEPTCEDRGYDEYVCSLCKTVIPQSYVPATGHTEVSDEEVPATCAKTGLTEGSHCSVCGKTLVAQTEIPKTAHKDEKHDGFCDDCKEHFEDITVIDSVSGLRAINNDLSGTYSLSADISLAGQEWVSIGTKETPFTGILYGNGYTVSDLGLSNKTVGGLFAYNSGTIISLKIKNFTLSLNGSLYNTRVMGCIAAYNNGTISDCNISGTNKITGNSGFSASSTAPSTAYNVTHNYVTIMGGVAGVNNSTVKDCTITGTFFCTFKNNTAYDHKVNIFYIQTAEQDYAKSTSNVYFGCFAGKNAGVIQNCTNSGTSTALVSSVANLNHNNQHIGKCLSYSYGYIGGIAGENSGTIISTSAKSLVATTSTEGAYTNDAYKVAEPIATVYNEPSYSGLVAKNSGTLKEVNYV